MNDVERNELEAEQAAREDYVREAYSSEAAMLNEIESDHDQYLYEVWLSSLTPEERAERDVRLAAQRAELAAFKAEVTANDDIPF